MKYTIADVQQDKLLELGLDIKDAFIITYIKELCGSKKIIRKTINNQIYYWIDHKNIMIYLPILGFSSLRSVSRRFLRYEELGLITRHNHKKVDPATGEIEGTFTFVTFEEKFQFLFEISKLDEDIEKMNKIAAKLGLSSEPSMWTKMSTRENTDEIQTCMKKTDVHHMDKNVHTGKSAITPDEMGEKMQFTVWTKMSTHNTTNNYSPINNTTTSFEKILKNKKPSSSQKFSFLEKEEYGELNLTTKNNIVKSFPDLSEDEFKKFYNLTKLEYEKGNIKIFNAGLFKGLKGEWEYSLPGDTISEILEPEKEEWLRTYAGLKAEPDVFEFVKKTIIKIPIEILQQNRSKLGRMNYSEFKTHISYLSKQASNK